MSYEIYLIDKFAIVLLPTDLLTENYGTAGFRLLNCSITELSVCGGVGLVEGCRVKKNFFGVKKTFSQSPTERVKKTFSGNTKVFFTRSRATVHRHLYGKSIQSTR